MEISAEIVLDCRFNANTMAVCERGFTLESRMCWNSSHLGLQSHLMGFARNLYGQGRQHISAVYLSPLPCPLGGWWRGKWDAGARVSGPLFTCGALWRDPWLEAKGEGGRTCGQVCPLVGGPTSCPSPWSSSHCKMVPS